ncbi:glutathione S-transferase family protein [Photobacterium sanguinicancri]|uniref:Glutathione S-transferase family protein n=1 Tax=Photobacterium sanguinicancri TaxID=875932 RepID=A0AAW7YB44_9GAMM|nr:glutathione S-transferase family protein [Photobacterium sanguinicancri]KXI24074.1 glutathione S-transferase [Photobacterium sanguinicancri]MDO6501221.1 glutathione S-transferase family protein [Photobacterium sanguinicancri]MDO6545559.1 glutathione S-transferase family protein [Photobacterium sanguinicancri]
MLTLYGYPRSRSLRVSWLLEELGLDWQYHLVNLQQGEQKTTDYLQHNVEGKVPTLIDNDLTLCESTAICLYLAERYGPHWLPHQSLQQQARHHQWISFIITELEQPLWSIGKHRYALPEPIRLPEMQAVASWEFKKAINVASHWLPESDYLFGNLPTVADLILTHTLNWATAFKQKLPANIEKYRLFVSQRPALMRALLKEQQALPT